MTTFVNILPDEAFYDAKDGLKRLKNVRTVYETLREKSVGGFTWEHKNSGYTLDGRPFFVGELTVHDEFGNVITVVGSAEGSAGMSISGVATMALENGALRGLGMAERFYKDAAPTETPVGQAVDPEPEPQPPTRQVGEFKSPFQNKSYRPNGNSGWDGTEKCKFGKRTTGVAYKDIDDGFLTWAATKDNPDAGAIKELNRRGISV